MAHNLIDYLAPGTSTVRDADGNNVAYQDNSRIVPTGATAGTAVNTGTSPNSNDGDPLRTSFIKLNNFMEASYRLSDSIDMELTRLDTKGPFLGAFNYVDLVTCTDELNTAGISTGNIAVISETLASASEADFQLTYSRIDSTTMNSERGQYILPAGSILMYVPNGQWQVVYQNRALHSTFDFNESLARLQEGTAQTTLTTVQQRALFDLYMNTQAGISQTDVIQATNLNDAIVEQHIRFSNRGIDAGYYG